MFEHNCQVSNEQTDWIKFRQSAKENMMDAEFSCINRQVKAKGTNEYL